MSAQHHVDQVTIVVVRSGGFAGLRREWRVDAGDDDADRWLVLVEACPWEDDSGTAPKSDARAQGAPEPDAESEHEAEDAPEPDGTELEDAASSADIAPEHPRSARPEPTPEPGTPPRAADRYVWIIRARTPEQRLETELPEPALTGPWRELVDAVRSVS